MAMTAVKLKIMPKNLDIDLNNLKKQVKQKIKQIEGILNKIEEEPIAFGLKALIATIAWPEEKDTDIIENAMQEIKDISSVEIIDYRRAFG